MPLNPRHPPGRVNRKALKYTGEIARLRTAGYTCEAIRSALADDGLIVSLSTVQREAAKVQRHTPYPVSRSALPAPAAPAPSPLRAHAPPATVAADSEPLVGSTRGSEVADTFMHGRVTNSIYLQRNNRS